MDKARRKQLQQAFNVQKRQANVRGIEFILTFDEWLGWWGSDIGRRGSCRDCLQMQRINDTGPYAIGNIVKGTPKQNSRTAVAMRMNSKTERLRREHQARLDALMWAESKVPDDDKTEEDAERLLRINGHEFRSRKIRNGTVDEDVFL